MPWATARAALSLALCSARRKVNVVFSGGEPLLEFPLLRKALEYVEASKPEAMQCEYTLQTNGTLITPEVADYLATRRVETFLSFDGVLQAQELRARGTYAALDDRLSWLGHQYPEFLARDLIITLTVTPDNLPNLARSVKYFIDKGVQKIKMGPVLTPVPGTADKPSAMVDQLRTQFEQLYELNLAHFQNTGRIPVLLFRNEPAGASRANEARSRYASQAMCSAVTLDSPVVDSDGRIYGCVCMAGSVRHPAGVFLATRLAPFMVGHIESPLLEVRWREYPQRTVNVDLFTCRNQKHAAWGWCRDCRQFGECVVCPLATGYMRDNHDPHRVPDFICAFNRVALDYAARFPSHPDARQVLLNPEWMRERMRPWCDLAAALAAE